MSTDRRAASPVRAWAAAHQALPAGIALALVAGGAVGFRSFQVATLGDGPHVPLWAFAPGTCALVVASVTSDRLGWLVPVDGRRAAARAAWVSLVLLLCGCALLPLAWITHDAGIVGLAVLLAATTFGLSALSRPLVWLPGAVADVSAFVFGGGLPIDQPATWIFHSLPASALVVICACVGLVVALYVVREPRPKDGT